MNRSVLDKFGARRRGRHTISSCCFRRRFLGHNRAGATWAEQLGRGRQRTDQKDQKPRHDAKPRPRDRLSQDCMALRLR